MFEQVKKLLIDELQIEAEDITMDAELVNDLGINSLELADLVLLCEEHFNIEINDEEIHKFISVGDVVHYLEAIGLEFRYAQTGIWGGRAVFGGSFGFYLIRFTRAFIIIKRFIPSRRYIMRHSTRMVSLGLAALFAIASFTAAIAKRPCQMTPQSIKPLLPSQPNRPFPCLSNHCRRRNPPLPLSAPKPPATKSPRQQFCFAGQ